MNNKVRTVLFTGIGVAATVIAIVAVLHFTNPLYSDNIKAIGELSPDGKFIEICPVSAEQQLNMPRIKVPYDLKIVKKEQESVDEGHSPWKLDPAFVAQVFVSLKIMPGGIVGDYPIPYEAFKIQLNDGKNAIIQVDADNTPIKKVYLKRLVRQDNTGIWTVVGYDPAD